MNTGKENVQALPEEEIKKEPEKTTVEEKETESEAKEDQEPVEMKETEKEERPKVNEELEERVQTEQEEVEEADEALGNEEETEAEAEVEERVAVFEQPLIVEGKRRRVSTVRLDVASPQVERPKKTYQGGKGVHLGSIDYVHDQVGRHKGEDLKSLYRVLYGTPKISAKLIKREIRAFSGFDFDENSNEARKRRDLLNKFTVKEINDIKQILGLIKKGDAGTGKEALINVIMQFLFAPDDHQRKVAAPKKAKKRAANIKLAPAAKRVKKSKKKEDEDEVENDEDEEINDPEEQEDEEIEEGNEDEQMEEENDETPKEDEETAHDASYSDVPSPKKVSFSDEVISPTHKQLVASCTRHVMEGKVDLETLTMKEVIEKVEAEFAKADLSERKEEIREIVRSLLVEQ